MQYRLSTVTLLLKVALNLGRVERTGDTYTHRKGPHTYSDVSCDLDITLRYITTMTPRLYFIVCIGLKSIPLHQIKKDREVRVKVLMDVRVDAKMTLSLIQTGVFINILTD